MLQQGHIHHTLEASERSIFGPVINNVDRLASSQKLDTCQLGLRSVVQGPEDDLPLVCSVAGVQRYVVRTRRSGGEVRVQGLEPCDGDPASPATRALKIPGFQFREGAMRTAEQTRWAGIISCRVNEYGSR